MASFKDWQVRTELPPADWIHRSKWVLPPNPLVSLPSGERNKSTIRLPRQICDASFSYLEASTEVVRDVATRQALPTLGRMEKARVPAGE